MVLLKLLYIGSSHEVFLVDPLKVSGCWLLMSTQAGPGRRKEMNWHRDGATGLLHLGILGEWLSAIIGKFYFSIRWGSTILYKTFSNKLNIPRHNKNSLVCPSFTFTCIHFVAYPRLLPKECDEDHLEWEATLAATGLDRRGVDTRALHVGRFLAIWKDDWRSSIITTPIGRWFASNVIVVTWWFLRDDSNSDIHHLGMSRPLFLGLMVKHSWGSLLPWFSRNSRMMKAHALSWPNKLEPSVWWISRGQKF